MKEPLDVQHSGTNQILILLFDEYHKMKESLYNRANICIKTILMLELLYLDVKVLTSSVITDMVLKT